MSMFDGYKFLLLIVMTGIRMAFNTPYIELNTRDSWFSRQQKNIAWTVYETAMCALPLNTTLSLVDCGNNGQTVKSLSSSINSISIESTDFSSSTHFYAISAQDSAGNSCGELSHLIHILPHVQTEVRTVLEGGSVCIGTEYSFPVYVFWPRHTGSLTNCLCPVPQSTVISFLDCYCLRLQQTNFIVTFNITSTELCWRNLPLAANGSAVGIVTVKSLNNCGDYTFLTALTYTRMVAILVEELPQESSANNGSTALLSSLVMPTPVIQSTIIHILASNFTLEKYTSSAHSASSTKVTSSQDINVHTQADKDMIILLSAGIGSVGIIFFSVAAIILLAIILIWKAKTKKNATISHIDPVYESPRFSMEVPAEPVYEDISLQPNSTTIEEKVSTTPNEAYTMRKMPQQITIQEIGMENNEAYAVRNMMTTTHNSGMEANEAYSTRKMTASAHKFEIKDNEAYALRNEMCVAHRSSL